MFQNEYIKFADNLWQKYYNRLHQKFIAKKQHTVVLVLKSWKLLHICDFLQKRFLTELSPFLNINLHIQIHYYVYKIVHEDCAILYTNTVLLQ